MKKNYIKKNNIKAKNTFYMHLSPTPYYLLPKNGFVALFTILVVSASVLIMAFSASLLGLGELDLGYTAQKGAEAFAIADGCTEESLRKLRLNSVYTGGYLTTVNGSCIINIVTSGSDRTITVTASTTDNYYKTIETNITLSADVIPIVTLNSWEEKTN
jgi:hypothetical protein